MLQPRRAAATSAVLARTLLRAITRLSRPLAASFLAVVLSLAPVAHADDDDRPPLRVTAIPDEAPTALIERFGPLAEYLAETLGREVTFTPVTDYAAAVEALVNDRVDLAWLGGFTHVQARLRSAGQVEPLVQRAEDEAFRTVFVARADSGVASLADLPGADFAFGSPSSTSGHLMPRRHLSAAGIDVDTDLRVAYSGAHDATALSVAGGRVDAGALNAAVWEALVADGRIDTDEVVVFETTPPYHDYNWSIAPGVEAATRDGIREAFLALDPDDATDARLLALQRASRFVATEAANYDGIEQAARDAGLLE